MKMTKRQWRTEVMSEIMAAREEAGDNHVCVTSQIQALSDQLRAIERRLPPEPVNCPSCWTEPLSPCEGVTTTNVPDGEMAVLDMPTGRLWWRTQNADGTWRDCIE